MPERILRAAGAEFAAHGYEGARITRIAAAARANRERLYHYLGDKATMFDACLADALDRIARAEPFAADDLGSYVAAMSDFHRREPDVLGLLRAEVQAPHEIDDATRERREAHYAQRVAAVREAQRQGRIAPDLDARVVVYAVLALAVTNALLPQLTDAILAVDGPGTEPSDAEFSHGLERLLNRPGAAPEDAR